MANNKAKGKRAQIWQARNARWKANAKHPWKVGDLCSAIYGSVGEGMIYRVTKVTTIPGVKSFYTGLKDPDRISLRVVPVFGILVDMEGRKPRTITAEYCTPLSLIEMGTMYSNFGLFISGEAKRLADVQDEPQTTPEEVPTRNALHAPDGIVDGDDCGLCTDIAARSE